MISRVSIAKDEKCGVYKVGKSKTKHVTHVAQLSCIVSQDTMAVFARLHAKLLESDIEAGACMLELFGKGFERHLCAFVLGNAAVDVLVRVSLP